MDGASGYNFSFPYALAEPPAWAVDAAADASRISLSQVAAHGRYGYRLRRDVAACGSATRPAVCIDVALTNAGEQPFTTPYYMANFFNAGGGPCSKNSRGDKQNRTTRSGSRLRARLNMT